MKKLFFLLALAVLTFGFMVTTTSCHHGLTGIDPQTLLASNPSTNNINVYFNIKNGGWGLEKTIGIVRTVDGSYFLRKEGFYATNLSFNLVIPSGETSLMIYWQGREYVSSWTYLSAKLNLVPGVNYYEILIDYNGKGKVVTNGLTDVSVWS